MNTRLLAIAGAAALAAACSSAPEAEEEPVFEAPVVIAEPTVTLPGASLADDELATRVAAAMTARAGASFTSSTGMACAPDGIEVVDRTITTRPAYDGAPWSETWLVDACREDMAYRVNYFPSAAGPTQFRIAEVPQK